MQRPDDLEQRLSSLALTQASDNYLPEGNRQIGETSAAKNLWPLRLNYALGLCLLLSVSVNVVQFTGSTDIMTAAADQCELHSSLPDPAMSPLAGKQPVIDPLLSPATVSGLWC